MSVSRADAQALLGCLDDPAALTIALCDIPSVSGGESRLADAVWETLGTLNLELNRDGDAIVARTTFGHEERVLIAGHLDTVPIEDNLPGRVELVDGVPTLYARGACDMKAGVAMQLSAAARLGTASRDVTWVFYDHEEVESSLNGLGRIARRHPDWLAADFAVLGEPTEAGIEGGCNGTIRVEAEFSGVRAHSARAWRGENAIHHAGRLLAALDDHVADTVTVDGLDYRESLSAVGISGGVAGNVVPDRCVVTINHRFAPSVSEAQAEARLRQLVADHAPRGTQVRVTDSAPGARPGLDLPAAAAFVSAIGGTPRAKVGWTDVARFAALGVPAVNFGPGDPLYAHKADEHVRLPEVVTATDALLRWLSPTKGPHGQQ